MFNTEVYDFEHTSSNILQAHLLHLPFQYVYHAVSSQTDRFHPKNPPIYKQRSWSKPRFSLFAGALVSDPCQPTLEVCDRLCPRQNGEPAGKMMIYVQAKHADTCLDVKDTHKRFQLMKSRTEGAVTVHIDSQPRAPC